MFRAAPFDTRSLLKKCAALNLPNYRRFGCEAETNAENYTCRMENNREGADNTDRDMRKTG